MVPLTGFQPPGPPAVPSRMNYLSAVGPLDRSAGDLRTALTVTAGPETPTASGYTWTQSPPRHRRLADFRVGVVLDHHRAPVSSEVTVVLSNAVDALAAAGATIVQGWPGDVDPNRGYESFGFHVGPFFAFQEGRGDCCTLSHLMEHEAMRMSARAAWTRHFADIDVFLCPANSTPAYPHDSSPSPIARSALPWGAAV